MPKKLRRKQKTLEEVKEITELKKSESAPQQFTTGLPFLDEILATGNSPPPKDMKEQLEKGGYECSLCIQRFREGDWIRLMPQCRHIFHQKCIDKWLRIKGQCPIDRKPI